MMPIGTLTLAGGRSMPVDTVEEAAKCKLTELVLICRSLVESEWPLFAQLNAIDLASGYTQEDQEKMRAHRDACRAKFHAAKAAIEAIVADGTIAEEEKVKQIDAVALSN